MTAPTSGLLTLAILAGLMMGGIQAWGGLFNRFSPELLSNLGYGANGGGGYRHNQVGAEEAFEPLEPDGALEAPGYALAECGGRSCYSDDSCCPGFLCIALNDFENFGRCVPNVAGRKLGEICVRDNECEAGLLCEQLVPGMQLYLFMHFILHGEPRVCRAPTVGHKQYNQECAVSSECDIARGLCCTMQRRHRQKARKTCSYFKDPLLCIGPVATDQIHDHVEHTAGEKRFGFYKRFH